jgi:hypothetical protein
MTTVVISVCVTFVVNNLTILAKALQAAPALVLQLLLHRMRALPNSLLLVGCNLAFVWPSPQCLQGSVTSDTETSPPFLK